MVCGSRPEISGDRRPGVGLPIPIAVSRLLAARRGRLELGLLRQPLGTNLLPHRLQFLNVLLVCVLLASALFTGAPTPPPWVFPRTPTRYSRSVPRRVLVLLLSAAVPLKHVRLASNLLVLTSSLFIATQLVMIYRPAENPVPIASPRAEEWLVGHGGHAEFVNYHYVTSTQRDAHDILQTRDGRSHQPGRTELTSYYIYGKPVLSPAAGTVTFVLDGKPTRRLGRPAKTKAATTSSSTSVGGAIY